MAPLRMSIDQGLHCLIRPVRRFEYLSESWLVAHHIVFCCFSLSLLCISRTPIRMSCTLAVDVHCCCCFCISCCCLCYYCCLVCIKQLSFYPFADTKKKMANLLKIPML